jgi:hypothetical protein
VALDAANPGTAAVTRTLTVPTGIKVYAICGFGGTCNGGTQDGRYYVSSLDVSDQAAGQTSTINIGGAAAGLLKTACLAQVRTNTAAQIRTRNIASDAATIVLINTMGWIDHRGRDA